jgi:hypothetical protein
MLSAGAGLTSGSGRAIGCLGWAAGMPSAIDPDDL